MQEQRGGSRDDDEGAKDDLDEGATRRRRSRVEGQRFKAAVFRPSEQLGFEPETMCWLFGVQ